MNNPYPKAILDAAKLVTESLAKTYPELLCKNYDSLGFPANDLEKSTFEERMQMGLYLELMKAGVI